MSDMSAARRHLSLTMLVLCALILLGVTLPSSAQVPDTSASSIVPRVPGDFSGVIWSGPPLRLKPASLDAPPAIPTAPLEAFFPKEVEAVLQPWATNVLNRFKEASGVTNPAVHGNEALHPLNTCYLPMTGDMIISAFGVQFLFGDKIIVMLNELNHFARVIYMDEEHPRDLQPSWTGHSIGHWEDDGTLVVDTVGYNDLSTVGTFGIYHTTALRTTERYRLVDNGKILEGRYRFEDPGAFTAPYETTLMYFPAETQEIFPLEYVCAENNDKPIPVSTKKTEPMG